MAGVSLFGHEKQILATCVVKLVTYAVILLGVSAIAPCLQLHLGIAADQFTDWGG